MSTFSVGWLEEGERVVVDDVSEEESWVLVFSKPRACRVELSTVAEANRRAGTAGRC